MHVRPMQRRRLWLPAIRPFDREASFTDLWRVRGGDARKLRSYVVNDVKIAVWAEVVAQTEIGASCLGVGCIQLNETRKCQKAVKGVIPLQASQNNRETAIGQWQSKTVPCRGSADRESCTRAIVALYAKFVQPSSVVAAESFEKIVGKSAVFSRTIGQLVSREVIDAVGDENVLVEVKWRRDALGEHVHDVVVGITSVIQLSDKTVQPFLTRYGTLSVGSMKQKPFKLQLTNAGDLGPGLEC